MPETRGAEAGGPRLQPYPVPRLPSAGFLSPRQLPERWLPGLVVRSPPPALEDDRSRSGTTPPRMPRATGRRASVLRAKGRCRPLCSRACGGGPATEETTGGLTPAGRSQSLSWGRVPRDSVLHKSEGARLSLARAACEDHPYLLPRLHRTPRAPRGLRPGAHL